MSQRFTELDNGSICPLCPEDNGTLIESIDACMGLVRKRSKGIAGSGQTRHSTAPALFFSDQDDVNKFVDNYSSEGAGIEKDCNRFHAGEVLSSLHSKGKNKLFDEKGVFGSVCRHDYPKSFCSLKYGERISYSVYELRKLNSQVAGKNLSIIIMYDIACILDKHLQNTNQTEILDNFGLAIPIFHCYGHKASCQVKYSPRRLEGVGLTDGEGVERLWSFLRDFSRMTKEMSAEKRTDVLTDALLYYGRKLKGKFGVLLKSKLNRAESLLGQTEAKIKELSKSIPVPCSTSQIKEWCSAELESLTPKEKVLELNWQEHYVELLRENKKISNDVVYATAEDQEKLDELQRKKRRNERALAGVEKKNKLVKRWKGGDSVFQVTEQRLLHKKKENVKLKIQRMASERFFLLELKKKYANGQNIAIKLSKQITKVTEHMKKNLICHNGLGGSSLSFEDVKDPCGTVYDTCSSAISDLSVIPISTKKQLVDMLCLKERCEEEIDLLKKEMVQLLSFQLNQINTIDKCIASLSETVVDKGAKALLSAKKLTLQSVHAQLEVLWQDLKISPYYWEAAVTWSCISNAPLNPVNSTIDDDYEEYNSDDSDVLVEDESNIDDDAYSDDE